MEGIKAVEADERRMRQSMKSGKNGQRQTRGGRSQEELRVG